MVIGSRLKELRESKNLSQETLKSEQDCCDATQIVAAHGPEGRKNRATGTGKKQVNT